MNICAYCDSDLEREPFRDPEEVKWLGIDGAATYCDPRCFDAETDARVEQRPVIV